MIQISNANQTTAELHPLSNKLWIYTNYDCNLHCSYCVAESHPRASKRAISLQTVERIVDEAVALGFGSIYFTGGEPFILDNIYELLAYASDKLTTTVLTNGMLFNDRRLRQLSKINNQQLTLQVSLDGACPEHHDPYRGLGSWQITVNGIHKLLDLGFHIRLSTTETPSNIAFIEDICEFRRSLGIPDDDHIIRPLAKRGFSDQGMEVGKHNLIPEITINSDRVYWHPLSTDSDLLVSTDIFPLAGAVSEIQTEFEKISTSQKGDMEEFQ